jgi:hypothetical protein
MEIEKQFPQTFMWQFSSTQEHKGNLALVFTQSRVLMMMVVAVIMLRWWLRWWLRLMLVEMNL